MANPEHVAQVEAGKDAFQAWRVEHPDVALDLAEAELGGVDLSRCDLRHADLSGANLRGADLQRADLRNASLVEAELGGANLRKAQLDGASLRGAGARGADLTWASLQGAVLVAADLREARLAFAELRRAFLMYADLGGADLKCASLAFADLRRAKLAGAHLADAVCLRSSFVDVDLSDAGGLDSVRHLGPSTIDVDTLIRSRERIPEAFLLGAGLSRALIDFVPALARERERWSGCFVSHAKADLEFARRLCCDLARTGIRCWRWEEDPEWGKPLDSVARGEALGRDMLLLVCSEPSLALPAIRREIEWAIELEAATETRILVPIALDRCLQDADEALLGGGGGGGGGGPLGDRWVADFRKWRKTKRYQARLDELVAALRR